MTDNKCKTDLKDYSTKLPMSEMQWQAILGDRGVAGIFKFAQKKYGNVSSWKNRTPESLARYESAMLRHYAKWKCGEEIDPESGLNHWAAIAWNALSILTFIVEDEKCQKRDLNLRCRKNRQNMNFVQMLGSIIAHCGKFLNIFGKR